MGPCLVYLEASWVSVQVPLGYPSSADWSADEARQGKVLGAVPAPLSPTWGRRQRWGDTISKAGPKKGLAPVALNTLFLSSFPFKFPWFCSQSLHPPTGSQHRGSHRTGSQNFNAAKKNKVTSLRPGFHRNNTETFVAINRSWLIYRKCKWNNPFCKMGLRALDLEHIYSLVYVWALLWAFPDGRWLSQAQSFTRRLLP